MIGKGTVAVVTGAGSGIGRALVKQLAMRGCSVALVDVNEKGLLESQQIMAIFSGKFTIHIADVTREEQMAALPEAILKEHPHIDMLFNNAGITIDRSFADHSLQDWQKIMGINLWGVIYGCHYFLPHLAKRPQSYLVNTSSLAGFLGIPTQSSYCATKAAVRVLSEALYAEYRSRNVHILSVHPGAVRTNIFKGAIASSQNPAASKQMFDLVHKVAMDPDKAAARIVSAAEKRKQRVIVGLDAKMVEITKRLMPVLIHHLFAWAFGKRFR